jgi:hypothetical protein
LYALSVSGVYSLKIFKNNISSFALRKTSSFVILSAHFIFNILLKHNVQTPFFEYENKFLVGWFLHVILSNSTVKWNEAHAGQANDYRQTWEEENLQETQV